jgi:hypothetical protein
MLLNIFLDVVSLPCTGMFDFLSQLTVEDMDRLHAQLPELVFSVSGPDLETITQFFLVKSVTGTLKTEDKEETAALEDRLVSSDFILRRVQSHLSLERSVLDEGPCIYF